MHPHRPVRPQDPTLTIPTPISRDEPSLRRLHSCHGDLKALRDTIERVLDAIEPLHRAGEVHGTLAIETIQRRPDGRIALLTIADREDIAIWERPFVSPERRRGGRITPASDVYSVAAVLYRLAEGAPRSGRSDPFPHPLPDSTWLPPSVHHVFAMALHPSSAMRPCHAGALRASFQEAFDAAFWTPTIDPALEREDATLPPPIPAELVRTVPRPPRRTAPIPTPTEPDPMRDAEGGASSARMHAAMALTLLTGIGAGLTLSAIGAATVFFAISP